jgi:hypothetical protein
MESYQFDDLWVVFRKTSVHWTQLFVALNASESFRTLIDRHALNHSPIISSLHSQYHILPTGWPSDICRGTRISFHSRSRYRKSFGNRRHPRVWFDSLLDHLFSLYTLLIYNNHIHLTESPWKIPAISKLIRFPNHWSWVILTRHLIVAQTARFSVLWMCNVLHCASLIRWFGIFPIISLLISVSLFQFLRVTAYRWGSWILPEYHFIVSFFSLSRLE